MSKARHFQDEELIAHLNGATGVWQRTQIRRHAASCLACRYRLNLLEEEMCDIIASAQRWQETDLVAIERAKNTFRERVEHEDANGQTGRASTALAARWRGCLAAAASGLAFVLTLILARVSSDPLARARATEAESLTQSAIRQEFELILSRPNAAVSRPLKIEVVFDPRSLRFSLVWRDADDSVVYGLWRPSAHRAVEYYAADNTGVRPLHRSTASEEEARFTAGLAKGVPDIQDTLVWWLENRDLAPIRLAREGLLVPSLTELGRPRAVRDVRDLLMLQWRTSTMDHPSVLTLSMNASSYRPVSQVLRVETAQVEVKLRLVHEAVVPLESIDPTIFEPSPLLIMADRDRRGFTSLVATLRSLVRGGHCM